MDVVETCLLLDLIIFYPCFTDRFSPFPFVTHVIHREDSIGHRISKAYLSNQSLDFARDLMNKILTRLVYVATSEEVIQYRYPDHVLFSRSRKGRFAVISALTRSLVSENR